jgi:hypothetical protein
LRRVHFTQTIAWKGADEYRPVGFNTFLPGMQSGRLYSGGFVLRRSEGTLNDKSNEDGSAKKRRWLYAI